MNGLIEGLLALGLLFVVVPALALAPWVAVTLALAALAAWRWLRSDRTLEAIVWPAALSIPMMARTHGIANALGFALCGVLGWRRLLAN